MSLDTDKIMRPGLPQWPESHLEPLGPEGIVQFYREIDKRLGNKTILILHSDNYKYINHNFLPHTRGEEETFYYFFQRGHTIFSTTKIKSNIDKKKKEIEKLQNQLASEELKRSHMGREVTLASQTQKMLSQKAEEARITVASKESPVKIVSSADVLERAIGPQKRKNVAISGIVALMLGIFLAFFIEYWQFPKETLEVK